MLPYCRSICSVISPKSSFICNKSKRIVQSLQYTTEKKVPFVRFSAEQKKDNKTQPVSHERNPILRNNQKNYPITNIVKYDTQLEIDSYIQNNLSSCRPRDISVLLNTSAKTSKKYGKGSFLRGHLPVITSRLKELSSSKWSLKELSCIIYGLQNFSSNEPDLVEILSVITTLAAESVKNSNEIESLQSRYVSMMIFGLKSMDSKEEQIRRLLSVIDIYVCIYMCIYMYIFIYM
jgi:hypothetical protein